MKRLLSLACLVSLACSPALTDTNKDGIADGVRAPNSVTQVAPANPVGTITGVVANTRFAPQPDANVLLVLGSGFTSAIKSGADGAFRFQNVPAGSRGQLFISKEGFGSVRMNVVIPVAAGTVPINDGNENVGLIMLLELNGSVRYQVQTDNGRPARGARALLEVNPAGFQQTSGTGYGAAQGQLSFEGQVDENGSLTFMNVPAPTELARVSESENYTLIIAGLDEDGDGDVEFEGVVDRRSGRSFLLGGVPTLRLTDRRASTAPAIVATNIESFTGSLSPVRNLLKPNESVWVVFNQPIAERTLLVRVTQEDCTTVVNTTVSVKGNVVQITAAGNGWTIGEKHNVLIRATGTEAGGNDQTVAFTGFVFGGDLAMPKAPMSASFQVKRGVPMTPANANFADGDLLIVNFDVPLKRLSTDAFLQWEFDLNQMGGVRAQDPGEFGSSSGDNIAEDEPTFDTTSQFACKKSGYTKRYTARLSLAPPTGIPTGTRMRLVLPVAASGQGGYQTIWGQPFTGQRDAAPTVIP